MKEPLTPEALEAAAESGQNWIDIFVQYGMTQQQAEIFLERMHEWRELQVSVATSHAVERWNGTGQAKIPDGFYKIWDVRMKMPWLRMGNEKWAEFYAVEVTIGYVNSRLIRQGFIDLPETSLDEIASKLIVDGQGEMVEDGPLASFAETFADALNKIEDEADPLSQVELRSDLRPRPKKFTLVGDAELGGLFRDKEVDINIDSCVKLLCDYVAEHKDQLEVVCRELHLMGWPEDPFLINNTNPDRKKIYVYIAETLMVGHPIELGEYVVPTFQRKALMKLLEMSGLYVFQHPGPAPRIGWNDDVQNDEKSN